MRSDDALGRPEMRREIKRAEVTYITCCCQCFFTCIRFRDRSKTSAEAETRRRRRLNSLLFQLFAWKCA